MKKSLKYIILIVVLLVAWQFFGTRNNSVRLLVSSPELCAGYFSENYSILLKATFFTFIESLLGLIIATGFAFLLMLFCLRNRAFFSFILPIVLTSQVIPLITLAPFFILWLGIGISSKVALSAVIAFYPIFMNFVTGYNGIPNNIKEMLEIYKASFGFKLVRVYFPLSLPNIFTGLRISATLSVIGAIVAEFSGTKLGLGKNLLLSAIRIEPELMMISIFLASVVGGILFGVIVLLERLIGGWYLNENRLTIG